MRSSKAKSLPHSSLYPAAKQTADTLRLNRPRAQEIRLTEDRDGRTLSSPGAHPGVWDSGVRTCTGMPRSSFSPTQGSMKMVRMGSEGS